MSIIDIAHEHTKKRTEIGVQHLLKVVYFCTEISTNHVFVDKNMFKVVNYTN